VLDREITVANGGGSGGAGSGFGGGGSGTGGSGSNGVGGLSGSSFLGTANGTGASAQATLTARWHRTSQSRLVATYGAAASIEGRLTAPGGAPIAGATIDLSTTAAYEGAKATAMAGARTDSAGRFKIAIAHGASSRTIRLSYRASTVGAVVATRTLTLEVHAGITLVVAPRTASVGSTIAFAGALHGAPIPAGGKQLVLEARSRGGAWVQFRVVRTDRHGRFRSSYRFRLPGPVSYQFRVLSGYEPDFPFLTGTSNVVGVLER
jgi:hypothetical protein